MPRYSDGSRSETMDDAEAKYLQDNRHIAERVLIFLQRRRLLRDRMMDEDYEECRKSAHELSKVFEGEMLTVEGKGFLFRALMDMQTACTNFVSAAGHKSQAFRGDDELFRYHLVVLREVFAQRVGLIVERFDLPATPEIQQIIERAS
jgi:hypothetical protein